MWTFSHTQSTTAPTERVWARWSDPLTWTEWDHDIAELTAVGPFDVGTRGTIRPVRGPRATFVLTEVEPGRRFAMMSPLPLATMTVDHVLEPEGDGARFTHRIAISGVMGPLFGRILGRGLAAALPATMRRLADLAERP